MYSMRKLYLIEVESLSYIHHQVESPREPQMVACHNDLSSMSVRISVPSSPRTLIIGDTVTWNQQINANQIKCWFLRRGENSEENLSEQSRELRNSTHIWHRVWELKPSHIGGRSALSTTPALHRKKTLPLHEKVLR